jgi:Zn finger protein HypA/HybF involved in hydrogenase expression
VFVADNDVFKGYSEEELKYKQINEMRASLGMRPREPATINCLGCGEKFRSFDKRQNKMCPKCRTKKHFD